MHEYNILDIERITGAKSLQIDAPDARIRFLAIDSRRLVAPAETLFFAMRGAKHDGHGFVAAAYSTGVRHFLVEDAGCINTMPGANVLQSSNPRAALQALGAHHRARFDVPVIGITGSNGTTMVKEWLYQVLAPDVYIVRSPGSYNSQVGVPLSVWAMELAHELAIFEAGISTVGEMARLAEIIKPTFGLFTNMGTAHAEGFANDAEKVAEKMLLFESADCLLYCADYGLIEESARQWAKQKPGRSLLSWSVSPNPGCNLVEFDAGDLPNSTRVQVGTDVFHIPFADAASRENAVHVWLAALQMGANPDALCVRMAALTPVAMRLELKAGINGCRLINDAYNNDLAALRIALQFARQQEPEAPLTVILSDIISGGVDLNALYTEVAYLLTKARVERLIGVGSDVQMLDVLLPTHIQRAFYTDSNALWDDLPHLRFQQEVVLLKGARAFAFERIALRLELKAHQTVLEVNLTAMVHNLHVYTRFLRPGAKIMVMVKAAGYGSGPVEVARLLEYHRADYLGVAYTDEGIELRQAGVRLPILVLNPDPISFDALVRFNLEPEVYSLKQLNELVAHCKGGKSVRVHVKLDTGMHRLGFTSTDLNVLCHLLAENPHIHVASVFSHLVGSDSPLHDAYTHEQAAKFQDMSASLMVHLGYPVLRHLVNTGGIARFPEYHFDMVRLGIGLYGVDGSPIQSELRVVHTLKATISQIKTLKAGMTVGYNRMGLLERDSRVATITVGYADGLLRLAGNGRYSVKLLGKLAPTMGNVCMDMTMIDVTDIPEAQEGDEVILFGQSPRVQELATCMQTIPYEVFTNIAQRVKRVFFQES